MANQIQVTVVNVNGVKQPIPLSFSFLTSTIVIYDQGVSSSPTANSRIDYYSSGAVAQRYFVTETIAELLDAANTGTTSQVQVTAYSINNARQTSPIIVCVPAGAIALQTVSQSPINTIVYFGTESFGVSDTEDDIVTAANVGGGGGGAGWLLASGGTLTGDNNVIINGHILSIGGASSFLYLDDSNSFHTVIGYGDNQLEISPTGLIVGLDNTDTFTYAADYSANYTDRSLVDKAWVVSQIPDSSGFALLAGRAGGQVLIGGTGTTDDLILRTTAGVGAAGATMLFQGGNNGATQFAKVDNDGTWNFGAGDPDGLHRMVIRQPSDGTAYYGIRIFANNNTTYSDLGYGQLVFNGGGTISTNGGGISLTPTSGNLFVTTGNTFIGGSTTPTARMHFAAGTATAGTAPVKLTAGTLLTTPELGAWEYVDDGTTGHLYFTYKVATVTTRREFTLT